MNTYKLTLERNDGTWGQYDLQAPNAARAMRIAAQNLDLDDAKAIHIVALDEEEDA